MTRAGRPSVQSPNSESRPAAARVLVRGRHQEVQHQLAEVVVARPVGRHDLSRTAQPTPQGATTGLPRALFPVERGNIQVRPSGF
jgi:hypothetical protein